FGRPLSHAINVAATVAWCNGICYRLRESISGAGVAESYSIDELGNRDGELEGQAPSWRLPDDPEGFVREAERITNEADLEAAVALYAPDGELESVTDGATEHYRGRAEITRAWRIY